MKSDYMSLSNEELFAILHQMRVEKETQLGRKLSEEEAKEFYQAESKKIVKSRYW